MKQQRSKIENVLMPFEGFIEYSKTLKKLPRNIDRETKPPHVSKMYKLIDENGFTGNIVVIRTGIFNKGVPTDYNGDGKHRTKAAVRLFEKGEILNQTICVTVVYSDSLEEIIRRITSMNNSPKRWHPKEYLNTWCETGNKEYLLFKEKLKERSFTMSTMMEIYDKFPKEPQRGRRFNDGLYKIDADQGDRIISLYIDLINTGSYWPCGASLSAITRFTRRKDFSWEYVPDLIKYVRKRKSTFGMKLQREQYLTPLGGFFSIRKIAKEIRLKKIIPMLQQGKPASYMQRELGMKSLQNVYDFINHNDLQRYRLKK